MRDWWRRGLAGTVTRLRSGGRDTLLWSLRITIAAVASYVVGIAAFPGSQPLLAPLTAMLVIQVTPVSLLASGADRVLSVVAGVALAVAFAAVVPLEWWSLGLLILVSLTIGQVLRLQSNLLEVAISAMLVLGVGSFSAGSAAWQRLAETLVGAAVGVALNLLFPPPVPTAGAGRAIDGLADSVSGLLRRAAEDLMRLAADGGDLAPPARAWLDDARRITHDIPQVGAALLQAEQGRRLNVRAVGTPNAGPGLRQGLEALEHSAVAIRSMFRALADATEELSWREDESSDYVLPGLAQTLLEMAAGVDAFGQLVRDEAAPAATAAMSDVQALEDALEGMHEARARLEELLVAGPAPELLEVHAVVLTTLKRLLRELDLDERIRRQMRLTPTRRARVRVGRPRVAGAAAPLPDDGTGPEAETQVLPRIGPDPDEDPAPRA